MKSIRILIFGNSYGNDAVAYLKKMLITKYEEVIMTIFFAAIPSRYIIKR